MQRKVFRIEQMIAAPRSAAMRAPVHVEAPAKVRRDDDLNELPTELAVIRDIIAANKRELGALLGDGGERRMVRAANELGAAVEGMESATQKILKAAEIIDDSAKTLTASLQDEFKRGVAQDIQDNAVAIYESCSFQDIAGQRIGKVIATLTTIEQQVTSLLARHGDFGARPTAAPHTTGALGLLNGPKLDGEAGHASQHDIDRLFG